MRCSYESIYLVGNFATAKTFFLLILKVTNFINVCHEIETRLSEIVKQI